MSPDLSGPLRRIWPHMAEESRRTAIKAGRAGPDPCSCRKTPNRFHFKRNERHAIRMREHAADRTVRHAAHPPTEPAEMKILAAAFGFSLNLRIFVLIIKRVIPRRDRQEGRRRRIAFRKERRCAHPAMPPKDGGETDPARCSGRSGTPTNTGDYANDTIFRVDHQ